MTPTSRCSSTWTSPSIRRRPSLQRPASLQLPSVMSLWRYAFYLIEFLDQFHGHGVLRAPACGWLLCSMQSLDVMHGQVLGAQPVVGAALAVIFFEILIRRSTVLLSSLLLGCRVLICTAAPQLKSSCLQSGVTRTPAAGFHAAGTHVCGSICWLHCMVMPRR